MNRVWVFEVEQPGTREELPNFGYVLGPYSRLELARLCTPRAAKPVTLIEPLRPIGPKCQAVKIKAPPAQFRRGNPIQRFFSK